MPDTPKTTRPGSVAAVPIARSRRDQSPQRLRPRRCLLLRRYRQRFRSIEESSYRAVSSIDGSSLNSSLSGFEFVHLMAGLDFRLSKGVGIGPTVAFTAAQYSTQKSAYTNSGDSEPYLTTSGSIAQQAIHEWFLLGVRVTLFP